jgi:hypothetical protein
VVEDIAAVVGHGDSFYCDRCDVLRKEKKIEDDTRLPGKVFNRLVASEHL